MSSNNVNLSLCLLQFPPHLFVSLYISSCFFLSFSSRLILLYHSIILLDIFFTSTFLCFHLFKKKVLHFLLSLPFSPFLLPFNFPCFSCSNHLLLRSFPLIYMLLRCLPPPPLQPSSVVWNWTKNREVTEVCWLLLMSSTHTHTHTHRKHTNTKQEIQQDVSCTPSHTHTQTFNLSSIGSCYLLWWVNHNRFCSIGRREKVCVWVCVWVCVCVCVCPATS